MKRIATFSLLLAALLPLACGQAASPAALPPDAAFPLPADWAESLPTEAAAAIDRAAESHRVLAIGEGDHYVVEKYAYRLALTRRLVTRYGLRSFAIEMGASDAGRIERYLESGDEAWLHRVVLYGYAGETDDEKRELAPMSRGIRRPCDDAWAEAERAFFRQLRALGVEVGEPIRLFGFDFDATPGGGYADARSAIAGCAGSPDVAPLAEALTPPRNTNLDAEVKRLLDVIARIDGTRPSLDAACGAEASARLRDALDQLAFSYRTFADWKSAAADTSQAGAARLRTMFVTREERMFTRFSAFQASLPKASPVAIFAHDMHVARDSESLRYGLAPHDGPMWASLGTRIDRAEPGSLWASWLLYGSGSRYTPDSQAGFATVALRPDTFEAALSATPGKTFIDVARLPPGAVVDRALPFGTDTSNGSGKVRGATDAIVFLPTASAAPGCEPSR
ncbi:hypothetical protein AKJ09_06248 [Labilithrix luteola]|uniref:Erythromycin esterase n=1 Tax=Labilithrix luteola TaxID=1391654 RepID=A0A0K1Q2H2_9BACT|nr:erythromycin esterase family protein [Labilithrix luteola]AKU99584.1 hypothetical protein AKJ09_06248 [Labilithrix luteola]